MPMTKIFRPLSQRFVRARSNANYSSSIVPEQFTENRGASQANAIVATPGKQHLIMIDRLCAMLSWARTASRYYAAAAQYEHLSKLSDAELERRGLCRSNPAQDLINARER